MHVAPKSPTRASVKPGTRSLTPSLFRRPLASREGVESSNTFDIFDRVITCSTFRGYFLRVFSNDAYHPKTNSELQADSLYVYVAPKVITHVGTSADVWATFHLLFSTADDGDDESSRRRPVNGGTASHTSIPQVFPLAVLDNAVNLGAIIFAVHLPSILPGGEKPSLPPFQTAGASRATISPAHEENGIGPARSSISRM